MNKPKLINKEEINFHYEIQTSDIPVYVYVQYAGFLPEYELYNKTLGNQYHYSYSILIKKSDYASQAQIDFLLQNYVEFEINGELYICNNTYQMQNAILNNGQTIEDLKNKITSTIKEKIRLVKYWEKKEEERNRKEYWSNYFNEIELEIKAINKEMRAYKKEGDLEKVKELEAKRHELYMKKDNSKI
jgi:hypothetical protein